MGIYNIQTYKKVDNSENVQPLIKLNKPKTQVTNKPKVKSKKDFVHYVVAIDTRSKISLHDRKFYNDITKYFNIAINNVNYIKSNDIETAMLNLCDTYDIDVEITEKAETSYYNEIKFNFIITRQTIAQFHKTMKPIYDQMDKYLSTLLEKHNNITNILEIKSYIYQLHPYHFILVGNNSIAILNEYEFYDYLQYVNKTIVNPKLNIIDIYKIDNIDMSEIVVNQSEFKKRINQFAFKNSDILFSKYTPKASRSNRKNSTTVLSYSQIK